MDVLVTLGVGLTIVGLVGLLACVVVAVRAKRSGLGDEAMRAKLRSLVAWNLGALLMSMLGLMTVIVALFLG